MLLCRKCIAVRPILNGRPRWGSASDPLSSVLLDLRLTGTFFCNSEFAQPWSLEIAERDFASFHFVATGDCWLQTARQGRRAETVNLHPGDLVLVPRSPHQVLSSNKRKTGTPIGELPALRLTDSASSVRVGGDARWLVVCGGVRFEGFAATTLVNLLPEVVVLRGDRRQSHRGQRPRGDEAGVAGGETGRRRP